MRKIICVLFLFVGISLSAQDVAVKTNLLYDVSTTINLGAEIGLSPKWTLDLSANYNGWTFGENKKCHFVGAHLLGGQYNWGGIKLPFGLFDDLENHRYEGWYAGGGLVYGYQWLLGKRWSIEAIIGVGYIRAHYDKYECVHCGEWLGSGNKNYLGVTKAAISLIYIIK